MELVNNKLNVIIFYDNRASSISTVKEHLSSFKQYSRHNIFYAFGTLGAIADQWVNFADVIIIHYSVRLSLPDYISPDVVDKISTFKGLKILFIQDEYENTYQAHYWIKTLGINIVFTCVPNKFIDCVYPKGKFPDVVFINNLTGYVPEYTYFKVPPLEERRNVVVYRGRKLGYWYGSLGQEKYEIGVKMKSICKKHQIPVDIECDDEKRFNNNSEWYNFLLSGRATLATESGANIFDWDGRLKTSIQDYLEKNPRASYEQIAKIFLGEDGKILMNQISPKVFQAIMCRTALILYEGDYSGVLLPGKHYIPLRKDWKNIEEVIKSLQDLNYLNQITTSAYDDILKSKKYSYQLFIRELETVIDDYIIVSPKCEFISVPAVIKCVDKPVLIEFWHGNISSSILDKNTECYEVVSSLARVMPYDISKNTQVIASTQAIEEHEFEHIIGNKDKNFYAAAVSYIPLPHFIEFSFNFPLLLKRVEICWFDNKNFGSEYSFKYLNTLESSGYLDLSWTCKREIYETHIIEFSNSKKLVSKLLFTVYNTAGQPRMLIRSMVFFGVYPEENTYKISANNMFRKMKRYIVKLNDIFNKLKGLY
jgi:hypothetical protein